VSTQPVQRELSPLGPPKIFGVGLSRTGTTSLHFALGLLGFRSIHYPPFHRLHELLERYDAAVDTPVACIFRELDALYPGSRFILTMREVRSWLASTQAFFAGPPPQAAWKREVRLRTYGTLEWNCRTFLRAYNRHRDNVVSHFADRPGALLILDITAGEGWDELCAFLQKPIPRVPFPHENKRDRSF
jgi:Sulfotransferase domain